MTRPEINILYKYRPCNGHTRDILLKDKIWYSTMPSYNDPFEGIVQVDKGINRASLLGHTIHQYLKDGHTVSETLEIVKRDYLDATGNITEDVLNRIASVCEQFCESNNKLGVLALSESPLSILMWSHYADEHKGMCIGFSRETGNALSDDEICLPVNYSEIYPHPTVGDLLRADDSATRATVRTKAIDWSYEKEWRLMHERSGLWPLPGPIKSIILGCRWDDKLTADVRKAVENKHVEIFKAKIVKGEFRLEAEPI